MARVERRRKHVGLVIEPETLRDLDIMAERCRRKRSSLIRCILQDWLEEHLGKDEREVVEFERV